MASETMTPGYVAFCAFELFRSQHYGTEPNLEIWDVLPPASRGAWEKAAEAVRKQLLSELESSRLSRNRASSPALSTPTAESAAGNAKAPSGDMRAAEPTSSGPDGAGRT